MIRRFIIRLLGGQMPPSAAEIRDAELRRNQQDYSLRAYKEFAESIQIYVGNYPAWKAQSEYRHALSALGQPLSGSYPGPGQKHPSELENVDIYLGRVVDAFATLCRTLPYETAVASDWYFDEAKLGVARGEQYLSRPKQPVN